MIRTSKRTGALAALLTCAGLTLAGCDQPTSASATVYYDAMLWNDYYYPRRPKPVNPIEPPARPVRPVNPIERPAPPIHRPSPGFGRGGGGGGGGAPALF